MPQLECYKGTALYTMYLPYTGRIRRQCYCPTHGYWSYSDSDYSDDDWSDDDECMSEDEESNLVTNFLFIMLSGKHSGHIVIITPSALMASSGHHTFGFRSIAFEGMHQFHSKCTEG